LKLKLRPRPTCFRSPAHMTADPSQHRRDFARVLPKRADEAPPALELLPILL